MSKALIIATLLSTSFLLGQAEQPSGAKAASRDRGQITVRGCVGKLNGDYVLMKEDPSDTYEIQGNKLRGYLGKRVEITGTESPSLATSEDALTKGGNASPETITINSIKTISEECENR